jgi:hypothetical protein
MPCWTTLMSLTKANFWDLSFLFFQKQSGKVLLPTISVHLYQSVRWHTFQKTTKIRICIRWSHSKEDLCVCISYLSKAWRNVEVPLPMDAVADKQSIDLNRKPFKERYEFIIQFSEHSSGTIINIQHNTWKNPFQFSICILIKISLHCLLWFSLHRFCRHSFLYTA